MSEQINLHPNEQLRQNNIKKYGEKDDDVIARTYRENKVYGDVFCAKNAEKYLRRYLSPSEKGNNLTDLYKVLDYVHRMIDANENKTSTEVIENLHGKQ